ncbi:MAG: glycosyltransferase family 4 protein [Prevotella sp.]
MRVLIVNTSEKTGGAALASNRLMTALNNEGVKAKMLVRDQETNQLTVVKLPHQTLKCWHFLWERWCIFLHLRLSRRHLFDLDIANIGSDITSLPEYKEADVIQLEWINQGMLSLKSIRKILKSGKPLVWTMHDIWPATAICHLALSCERFKDYCNFCPYLPGGGSARDLSAKIWNRKKNVYSQGRIHFVTCSDWLGNQARQSGLLKHFPITTIPNPIDTKVFAPHNRKEAAERLGLPTDRKLILFASQRITNANKGIQYLIDACKKMVKAQPEAKEQIGLVILGGHAEELLDKFAFPTYSLGYVNDTSKIVDVYNAVDVFVLPSLSENLPNTIMEAMACGVPCVGFDVGGIPEMIDHLSNGYIARFKDSESLAEGIQWILNKSADSEELSSKCIKKVHAHYAQSRVALRYIEVYEQELSFKEKLK